MAHFLFADQKSFRNRHHFVAVFGGDIDDRQFQVAGVLGKISGGADFEAHGAFDLRDFGEELADQKQNQAAVDQKYPDSFPTDFKTLGVRGQQIDQQNAAEEPP